MILRPTHLALALRGGGNVAEPPDMDGRGVLGRALAGVEVAWPRGAEGVEGEGDSGSDRLRSFDAVHILRLYERSAQSSTTAYTRLDTRRTLPRPARTSDPPTRS